jgi:rubrerythrin
MMSATQENLEAAFAGESQANRKYLFFAQKAEDEGHPQIAKLFRAAADAETVHARNHFGVLNGVKSTRENLQAALEGENYEFTQMYPAFIEKAKAEGDQKAEASFNMANKVEQIHHDLYHSAIEALEKGEQLGDEPIYVCQRCGNTVVGHAPDRCPICGVPKERFTLID